MRAMQMRVVLIVATVLQLSCDGALNVSGQVVDGNGHPVRQARVSAYSAAPETTALTGGDGCFHIFRITRPSEHQVPFLVEASGYETFLGSITYPNDKRVTVHMRPVGRRELSVAEIGRADDRCVPARERSR
jgi:hypothetical protein